jgi:hypothetical protein
MNRFYKNHFFWISVGFTALVAWGFVIAQKTQETESNAESNQSQQEKAVERAKLVGRHLIETQFIRKVFTTEIDPSQARGLASIGSNNEPPAEANDFKLQVVEEGQTGRDPWGFPFSYKKSKNQLTIWSLGPNHKLDSTMDQLDASKTQGDDIIVTLSL